MHVTLLGMSSLLNLYRGEQIHSVAVRRSLRKGMTFVLKNWDIVAKSPGVFFSGMPPLRHHLLWRSSALTMALASKVMTDYKTHPELTNFEN